MDYGRLIRDAWNNTWRYRWLWVLGLFAGGTVGGSFGASNGGTAQWRADAGSVQNVPPELARLGSDAAQWVQANLAWLILAGVILAVLAITLLIVSLIAQGAMAEATVDVARGRPITLGGAWGAGLHYFWRYVGLWLMLIAAVLILGAAFGSVAALGAQGGSALGFAVLLGALLAIAALALAIGGSIVVAYAQRSIAAEDVGPIAALKHGWSVLRAHIGASLLVWLLQLALGIAAGIGIAVALALAVLPLGGIGYMVWLAAAWTAPTIGYIVLAGLALLALLLLVGAVTNTFFWNYWTLAYLRLSGEPADGQHPAPAAP